MDSVFKRFKDRLTGSDKPAPKATAKEPIEPIIIGKPAKVEPRLRPMTISDQVLGSAGPDIKPGLLTQRGLPQPLPGVLPRDAKTMAQDEALSSVYDYGVANGMVTEGLTFLGYPYLAELSQRPENRKIVETIAQEATRKWIEFYSTDEKDDKSNRVAAMDAAMVKFGVRDAFRRLVELDGYFGRAHLFLDTGYELGDPELETFLITSPAKIDINGLKRLQVVEPFWTYPGGYDAINPLSRHFYQPEIWYIQGKKVHASRLLTFVAREVPDMLKPIYMFGGQSMTQIAKPYVDNWLRTRTAVTTLIEMFSLNVLKTNMDSALSGGPSTDVLKRVDLFNRVRDNRGTLLLDMETEDFANISTPLGTLDHLQAQAQEQLASVSGIPLVKLLGIQPSGLNASSEGEIRVFYDTINAYQEHFMRDNLRKVIRAIELSEFGNVDDKMDFRFQPLWEMDEGDRAQIRASNAGTAIEYVQAGIILPEEERERLAREDGGIYNNLDLTVAVTAPVEPQEGGPDGPEDDAGSEGPEEGAPPAETPPGPARDAALAEDARDRPFSDAEWDEARHRRAANGQFTSGQGASGIIREALNPAHAKSAQTALYLKAHHAKIEKALLHSDVVSKLNELKAKLPVNNYNNRIHYYLDQLIREHRDASHPFNHFDLIDDTPEDHARLADAHEAMVKKHTQAVNAEYPSALEADMQRHMHEVAGFYHQRAIYAHDLAASHGSSQAERERATLRTALAVRLSSQLKSIAPPEFAKAVAPPREGLDKMRKPDGQLKLHPKLTSTQAEEMHPHEFKAKYGVRIESEAHGSTLEDFKAQLLQPDVMTAVSALPRSHRELLKDRVPIRTTGMIDLTGQATTTGITGRGNALGLYHHGSNSISVAASYIMGGEARDVASPGGTTAHEIGHAIDHRLGWPSGQEEFVNSIPPKGQRGTPTEEARSEYFQRLPSEVWAECYNTEFGNDITDRVFHGMTRQRAKQVWAGPIAVMKKIIKERTGG